MSKGPERDIIKIIFQNFLKSLRPRKFTGTLVGEDSFGNKFYEIPADPANTRAKRARYFEPKDDKDAFDQEMNAEWESWLRGRRQDPPTQEEVLRNLAIADMKQKNAAKLDAALAQGKDLKVLEKEQKGMGSFPDYGDEYELSAGVKNKK
ncbi:NADH dehydrogenase [Sergentomyia squamirostris]